MELVNDEYFVISSNCIDEIFVSQIFRHFAASTFMIEERLRVLVRYLGAARLAVETANNNRRRWQTVATDMKTKTRVEDLEQLIAAFPQYELWLWKGETDPASGQVAPDVDS
ncbi:hypothetical protein [Pseudomonas sp. DP-17]|uniref:hypothetical protein n=1 Tax=Pseudomonas sp. DP-17 TaxID=1580486 RepID=UPI001EFADCFE|nr:hypothetical protein [Pseudomonas sp. DP-17]MCG8909300.1 hypothetical protein [Pseudomonas sp. DP-17]